MKLKLVFWVFFLGFGHLHAQDTLPSFKVSQVGNDKVILSWINHYPVVNQINIQRSNDSLRNFITILTVPDPAVVQNGISDQKIPAGKVYYRLFILLDNGRYVITPSQRPVKDESGLALDYGIQEGQNQRIHTETLSNTEKNQLSEKLQSTEKRPNGRFFVVVKGNKSFQVKDADFKKFRDSILYKTKDTLDYISIDSIQIKPFATAPAYVKSSYIYPDRDGNVILNIPGAAQRNYRVRFLHDDRRHFFTLDRVTENYLEIDKAIFLQSGWYRFELYEDGKLKEENRFFIPKDF
jgi:hypothetical protein